MKDYQIYSSYGFSEMYNLRNSITQNHDNSEKIPQVNQVELKQDLLPNNLQLELELKPKPKPNLNFNKHFQLNVPIKHTGIASGGIKRNTTKRKKKLRKHNRNTKKTTRK